MKLEEMLSLQKCYQKYLFICKNIYLFAEMLSA